MRLTTKGRYAVTAMIDLALHNEEGPVALADIAKRQGISLSYLEQLFARLRSRGLVVSTRGPGGGYSLGRSVGEIPVGEVIEAVDEKIDATRCGGQGNCRDRGPCLTHELWVDLSEKVRGFLAGITLGDFMKTDSVREVMQRQKKTNVKAVRRPAGRRQPGLEQA